VSKIPIKIGALGVTPESHSKVFSYLQSIGVVETISATTKRGRYDIIVLPPDTGINPNLDCFKHGNRVLLPISPILPSIEKFRVDCLDYYIDQGTYVIGLGDNAALLWDKIGGKAIPTSFGIILKAGPNAEVTGQEDELIDMFRHNNTFGISDINKGLSNVLLTIKEEIKASLIEEAGDEQEINPNQPNPVLTGRETPPEEEENSSPGLNEIV